MGFTADAGKFQCAGANGGILLTSSAVDNATQAIRCAPLSVDTQPSRPGPASADGGGTASNNSGGGIVRCKLATVCDVDRSLSGTRDIAFRLSDVFQIIRWRVAPSGWNGDAPAWEHVLSPSLRTSSTNTTTAISNDAVLAGTDDSPTVLNFVALRSIKNNRVIPDKERELGVQLGFSGTTRKTEQRSAKNFGAHFVAFRFSVPDNVYVVDVREKTELATRLGTVLTLMLSSLTLLKSLKKYAQAGIDTGLKRAARKSGKKVPTDVQDRSDVLQESNIGKVRKRLSIVRRRMDSISGNGEDGNRPKPSVNIEMLNLNTDHSNPITTSTGAAAAAAATRFNRTTPRDASREKNMQKEIDTLKKEMAVMKKSMAALLSNQKMRDPNFPNFPEKAAAAAFTDDDGDDEILTDDATGRRYSWNPTTNETKWLTASNPLSQILIKDKATAAAAASTDDDEILIDEATGRRYSWNPITRETKWL